MVVNRVHEQNNETITAVKGGTHLPNGADIKFRTLVGLSFRKLQALMRFLKKYRFPYDR